MAVGFALPISYVAWLDGSTLPPGQARVAAPVWALAAVIFAVLGALRLMGVLAEGRLSSAATTCALAHSIASMLPVILTGDAERIVSVLFAVLAAPAILTSGPAIAANTALVSVMFALAVLRHPGPDGIGGMSSVMGYGIIGATLIGLIRIRGLQRIELLTDQLRRQATTDALTGLLNRHGLTESVRGLQFPGTVSVMCLDLDGFKAVNDRIGHGAGDALLARVADTLKQQASASDIVGRIGGDEFVIVAIDAETGRHELLERSLRETLGGEVGAARVRWGVSIGRASNHCPDTHAFAAILHEADLVMYQEKKTRRAATTYRTPAAAGTSPTSREASVQSGVAGSRTP